MVIIVWLLVGNSSHYYWLGALAGVLLVLGFESLARARLLAFLGWSIVFVVGIAVLIGLLVEWRLTLGVLLLAGAIVLLAQNVNGSAPTAIATFATLSPRLRIAVRMRQPCWDGSGLMLMRFASRTWQR